MNQRDPGANQIPGLRLTPLEVQRHDAGWFVEAWHHQDPAQTGIDFLPVQHNLASFDEPGVTRGFHAEPWDRVVQVISGRVMGAWLDLREGPSFGKVYSHLLQPGLAVTVPRGVGNSFQVTEGPAVISTLMNGRWTPEASASYLSVDPFDPALGIHWPVPPSEALRPNDGRTYPPLAFHQKQKAKPAQTTEVTARRAAGEPFKVMFVCTANICRSAYADVIARGSRIPGLEFSSAGTMALVGESIDPPMGRLVGGKGDVGAHVAQQLTRDLVAEADLVLAMAGEHRRYILREWPALARSTFVIGHVARELAKLPADVTLENVTDHLWNNRTSEPEDDVADPYGRGDAAARAAADQIDAQIEIILRVLGRLATAERA